MILPAIQPSHLHQRIIPILCSFVADTYTCTKGPIKPIRRCPHPACNGNADKRPASHATLPGQPQRVARHSPHRTCLLLLGLPAMHGTHLSVRVGSGPSGWRWTRQRRNVADWKVRAALALDGPWPMARLFASQVRIEQRTYTAEALRPSPSTLASCICATVALPADLKRLGRLGGGADWQPRRAGGCRARSWSCAKGRNSPLSPCAPPIRYPR